MCLYSWWFYMCWPKGDSTVLFLILIKHPKMLLVMTLFLKCQLLKKRQCLWSKYQAAILSTSVQCCCKRWAGIPRGPEVPACSCSMVASCSCMPSCAVQGRECPFCSSRALFQRQGADTPVNRSALSPNASLLLSLDSWNWPGSIESCSFHGGMQFDLMRKLSDLHYFALRIIAVPCFPQGAKLCTCFSSFYFGLWL